MKVWHTSQAHDSLFKEVGHERRDASSYQRVHKSIVGVVSRLLIDKVELGIETKSIHQAEAQGNREGAHDHHLEVHSGFKVVLDELALYYFSDLVEIELVDFVGFVLLGLKHLHQAFLRLLARAAADLLLVFCGHVNSIAGSDNC